MLPFVTHKRDDERQLRALSGLQNPESGSIRREALITDLKMEHETAGYDVVRAANKLADPPVVAILTAFASLGSTWKSEGAQSLFVKPMNTPDLLRAIESLLIAHEDRKTRSVAGSA